MFRNPVVATGFPIRSRNPSITENCGMEMSLGLVALLTNCRQVVPFAGTTFLKGFAAMLAAVKIVGDTVLWHLCYNPQGGYISYEDPRVDRSGVGVDAPQIPLQVIRHKRHIIGWTDRVENLAGKLSFPQSHLAPIDS